MPMFDAHALAHARRRAAGLSPSFLDKRIWDDIADRIAALQAPPRRAMLLGPATEAAVGTLAALGITPVLDLDQAHGADALLAVRWAETEDDLAEKLAALAILLPPDIPLIGASLGGDSLPTLRTALIAADRDGGAVSPRVHPRLEPGAFAELLQRAGFARPVVDVDRVRVRYSSLDRLVGDLRALGAGNALADRSRRYPGQAWRERLVAAVPPGAIEQFDILHFSAWTGSR